MSENTRSIDLTRVAQNHYRAEAPSGASVEFGSGEGLMTPVELLLAAIAGCSSIDVDTVTSRRTEPTRFTVKAAGEKLDEDGASRLEAIELSFDITFLNDADGQRAKDRVEKLVTLSHDKYCTVSRTVEHGTPVSFHILDSGDD
ncbi:OsmC family protein [Saxibacter everestensis]|uniref:OsmC family protein n=1 Tax=Saxibacter everestensis TaxID=2909229 RepID=A0ABY8QYD6_9MICO|nr:OsmC family protein [Brevibacteriaceae bacterium ZFBP1038]